MVTIEVDLSQLDKFGPKMPEIRREGLKLTALDMQRTVDKLSPIDEGLLHKWAITDKSDTSYTIHSPAKYVGFVNYGTGPHFIRPTKKKALHWDGKYFSKGHTVGGQRAQKFIERAIDQVTPRIDDHFKTAIAKVLK